MEKINECLQNKHGSYILPFLWLHGEDKGRIKEEILAIKNSGINELCAESRPYEKFCQDEWWDDFKFILDTARELNMGVWLLDDQKFPTGYANGYLEKEENAHLRKKLIREFQVEALGPSKFTKIFVGARICEGEKILGVIAYKHIGTGEELDPKSAIDLTDKLSDGMVYWDVPNGNWRVCVTVKTEMYEYKNDRLFYYIDMLNRDSCHAMIDAIYEPHYKHFKEYFGNTFRGFFSDEPGFLNVCYTYNNQLGDALSPYPWRDDLCELIAENAGLTPKDVRLCLPALWENLGGITAQIRANYMDVVTKLYRENFSYLLGNWCRERGAMYIGHVIEDMGAHTRLGYGSGHYFRALDGQDMAGVDIVLHQDVVGISDGIHRSPLADGGKADPAFFRYTLPKLAASHSHLQPLKKGRAMCEIFGAFGWAEGLPFMKGLSDIMLASGINHFVPHAFSPKEEDTDCPPHFYNGGKNIQYPLFKNLMEYMGRVSHALNGAIHRADVAVFYNAECEWTTQGEQLLPTLCRKLTQNLIDFDIVPYDILKGATVKDGKLYINGESFGALVISKSEALPLKCLELFASLAKSGLPVIFTDELPRRAAENIDISELNSHFKVENINTLPDLLRNTIDLYVSGEGENLKGLRFYHATRDGKEIYLFSNEDVYNDVNAQIKLKHQGECLIYEPWDNKIYRQDTENGTLEIHLEKGNMIFAIFGAEIPNGTPKFTFEREKITLPLAFDVSIKGECEKNYRKIAENSPLFDISAPERYPDFSGEILYEAKFAGVDGFTVIDLGQVGEVAEAWLNGEYLGARICAPYKFCMKSALKSGENELRVIVRSNLAHKRRDLFSTFIQIPPSGILGDISLCRYE